MLLNQLLLRQPNHLRRHHHLNLLQHPFHDQLPPLIILWLLEPKLASLSPRTLLTYLFLLVILFIVLYLLQKNLKVLNQQLKILIGSWKWSLKWMLWSLDTWELVLHPISSNVVGSKWVFRPKFHFDDNIESLKELLVAQGFTQILGQYYSLTFSHVVKATTVLIFLSLAVLHRRTLHQLDVKNVFLNGNLTNMVFMEQPLFYWSKVSTSCMSFEEGTL